MFRTVGIHEATESQRNHVTASCTILSYGWLTSNRMTGPVGDAYGMMCTTRMIPVLNNISGFKRKFEYGHTSPTLSTEWGGVNNVRAFVSEQGSVTPIASLLGNDVANCFVAAKESYKVVWQAGGKAKFIYLPPGYNSDPCMLRHTAGCSFYQGQCITNDLWMQNLRSTGI